MTTSGIGLRELKKQMTRESIADAALKLTLEKGLEHVTIDEIAQLAFISPRTVSNYFSCKEEAVVAAGIQDSFTIIEDLAERPLDEPPLESLSELLAEFARSRTTEQLRLSAQKVALSAQHPSLRPFQTAQYDQLEAALRDTIAGRTGTDVQHDLYPWLVAAAAVSAVRAAMQLWVESGAEPQALPELIQRSLTQISNGLPAPQTRPRRMRAVDHPAEAAS